MLSEDWWYRWSQCGIRLRQAGVLAARGGRTHHHAPGALYWLAIVVLEGHMELTTARKKLIVPAHEAVLIPPDVSRQRRSPVATKTWLGWFAVHAPAGMTSPLDEAGCPVVVPLGESRIPADLTAALDGFDGFAVRDRPAQVRAGIRFQAWLAEHLVCGSKLGVYDDGRFRPGTPCWLVEALDNLTAKDRRHGWTVAGLAAEMGVHPSHLAKVCRQHTDRTPGEWLRAERVRAALVALTGGQARTVEAAAELFGYSSMRAFWRQCVAVTGRAPSSFLHKG